MSLERTDSDRMSVDDIVGWSVLGGLFVLILLSILIVSVRPSHSSAMPPKLNIYRVLEMLIESISKACVARVSLEISPYNVSSRASTEYV